MTYAREKLGATIHQQFPETAESKRTGEAYHCGVANDRRKIIKEAQRNAFEAEIRALENNQPLPRRRSLLPLTGQFYHENDGHRMGVSFTMKHIREKILVIYVRQEVKRTNKDCSECVRRFEVPPVQK